MSYVTILNQHRRRQLKQQNSEIFSVSASILVIFYLIWMLQVWLSALLFQLLAKFDDKIHYEGMVIQTNPFAYRQIDIQTVMPQNFKPIFQLLHSKKNHLKCSIIRCVQFDGVPHNETEKTS